MAKRADEARASRRAGKGRVWHVLIVDDHAIVRQGLTQLLTQAHARLECREAASVQEALACMEDFHPDLVVVDISLRTSNGIELTKAIRRGDQAVRILILSMHDEVLYAERALRAGANGYVMKSEAAETIVKAVQTVLDGGLYLSERAAGRTLGEVFAQSPADSLRTELDRLSDREIEILELIGRGWATREIAAKLSISQKTVETHRGHLKHKLRLKNSTELIQRAANWVTTGS